MTLPEVARERLADIVALQPTKNGELQDRWGMESGSEVHQYLESELGEYYYRNNDSLICATPEAEALLGEGDGTDIRAVAGTELDRQALDALPGPSEEPQSVVATLHDVREAGASTDVDEVRSTLHGLVDRGLVDRVQRAVPTFRLALERDMVAVEPQNSAGADSGDHPAQSPETTGDDENPEAFIQNINDELEELL